MATKKAKKPMPFEFYKNSFAKKKHEGKESPAKKKAEAKRGKS